MKVVKAKNKNSTGFISGNEGFTLIEMAIVLIIIGIIIGAVVKGKDLIRGAEQKKVYSKFVNEWRTAYMNFYDRTGKILGDTSNPLDGETDGATCTQLVDGDSGSPPVFYGLSQIGLNPPVTNSTDACIYRYTDSEGGSHGVTVTFDYGTDTATRSSYNYLHLTNLPLELAIALDRMIDGEADGTKGDFVRVNGTALLDWIRTSSEGPTSETQVARWKMEF